MSPETLPELMLGLLQHSKLLLRIPLLIHPDAIGIFYIGVTVYKFILTFPKTFS